LCLAALTARRELSPALTVVNYFGKRGSMSKNHTIRIIDALGEDVFKDRLGWTDRAIRHAKSFGLFSGLWYRPVRRLCDEHGIWCPEEAFTWKDAPKKDGSNRPATQGDAT
jgi:hypothetical protein